VRSGNQSPILAALVLSTGAALATAGRVDAAAGVVVEAPVHQFGTVMQGDLVRHTFKVHSAGNAPLRVEHVKPSCGCLVTAAEGQDVPAGSDTFVTLELDTRELAGPVTKTVLLYTNDPVRPTLQLTLLGEVESDVVLEPPVLYFGRVRAGRAVRRQVQVRVEKPAPGHAAAAPVLVTAVAPPGRPLSATLEATADGGQAIAVELAADAPLGHFTRTVRFRTTSARQPDMTLEVLGSVEGDIAVTPPTITFGVTRPGGGRVREVWIRNRGVQPVELTVVQVPEDVLGYELRPLHPGSEYLLRVWLRDDAPPGTLERDIQIFTNHPSEMKLVVPVHAVVRG
jgi:hypothetical protein